MNKKKLCFALAACWGLLASVSVVQAAPDSEIPKFRRLSNVLSYGGAPTIKGLSLLRDRHIGTVVDLRAAGPGPNDEKREVERLKMDYLGLPIGNGVPTEQQVSKFVQLLQTSQPKENMDWFPAVYVHGDPVGDCGPALIAIWHEVRDHWDYKRAIADAGKSLRGENSAELKALVKDYADGTKKIN